MFSVFTSRNNMFNFVGEKFDEKLSRNLLQVVRAKKESLFVNLLIHVTYFDEC